MRRLISKDKSTFDLVEKYIGSAYDELFVIGQNLQEVKDAGKVYQLMVDTLFYKFTATASQTVFTGPDANGRTVTIQGPEPIVYVDLARIDPEKFTVAGDGSSLTFLVPIPSGSEVLIGSFGYNADGTIYYDELLSQDSLVAIAADADAAKTAAEAAAASASGDAALAAGSETSAAASAVTAGVLADEAMNWANYPEDSLVPEGNQVDEYSARHWAAKAEAIVGGQATSISYDNVASGLTAIDVQAALDEIVAGLGDYRLAADQVPWAELSGVPATFAPSAHSHPISEVTDLQTNLDAKFDKAGGTVTGAVTLSDSLLASGAVRVDGETLVSSTAIALGLAGASKKHVVLDHDTTITVSGAVANQVVEVWIEQGVTGGIAAWSGVSKWVGGAVPTLSTTQGEIDIIVLATSSDGLVTIGQHVGVAS